MDDVQFRFNDWDLEVFIDGEWVYCSNKDCNMEEMVNDIMGMLGIGVVWNPSIAT